MAVEINVSDNKYIGTLKADADVKNGLFVKADFSAGTAAVVGSTPVGDESGLYLVNSVNTNIDEQGVGDIDFVTASGEYLRLKALAIGNIFATDQVTGTYGSINKGDVFAPSTDGKVEAIGSRTPAMKFSVIEKLTLNGNDALKLIVTQV